LIKIKEVVVVEGKYDKITLENYIDATIIVTNGFSVFKDKEKQKLIPLLAKKNGIIIMTDSDSAGIQIRQFIKKICSDCEIKNIYIPQILGKEKRKSAPSKEGYLGVEGMNKQIILDTLKKFHIGTDCIEKQKSKITKLDLYGFGLLGTENSSSLRNGFCSFASLPIGMSSSAFLDAINALFTLEEFRKSVELWRQGQDKK